MTSEFDTDTQVEKTTNGQYKATISDRWNIMTVPNGGYLMAVMGRALRDHLSDSSDHCDPLTMTAHFFKPVTPGEAQITTSTIKQGRALSYVDARLIQDDVERIRITSAYGNLETREGMNHVTESAPDLPPFDDCVRAKIPLEFFRHVKVAFTPETGQWLTGEKADDCTLTGWTSFSDGREPDVLSLLLFADGFPPPIFRRIGPVGWVPAVELTVQIRNKPAPGPLRCRFKVRYVTEGYLEEDGEIWDSEGNIVALARQLAMVRLPE